MGFLDKFAKDFFAELGKERKKEAIEDLKKEDPNFAKAYASLEKDKERIRKRLKTMTEEEIDDEINAIFKKRGIK